MISTSYPVGDKDWRGRFIADMIEAIAGNNIELLAWLPPGHLPSNVINVVSETNQKWLGKMQSAGGIAHLLRTKPLRGLLTALSLIRRLDQVMHNQQFDVAHINWLQNALPLRNFRKPALITVLGSDYGLLKLPGMVFLLRKVLKRNKCILAPNAEWMVGGLQKCFGDIAEIRPISFGIHPRFLEAVRSPPPVPNWLVVTRITHSKIGQLFEWGKSCFGPQRMLHLFGPMQEEVHLPDWIIWHGPADPDQLAKTWFPYATGLITLSHHDEGRPQVLLDAMAAGLPVIVSAIPAHRDLIQHAKTGWVAESPGSFREALCIMECASTNITIGKAAREYVLNSVGTWADCADRYEQAYRDLLAKQGK